MNDVWIRGIEHFYWVSMTMIRNLQTSVLDFLFFYIMDVLPTVFFAVMTQLLTFLVVQYTAAEFFYVCKASRLWKTSFIGQLFVHFQHPAPGRFHAESNMVFVVMKWTLFSSVFLFVIGPCILYIFRVKLEMIVALLVTGRNSFSSFPKAICYGAWIVVYQLQPQDQSVDTFFQILCRHKWVEYFVQTHRICYRRGMLAQVGLFSDVFIHLHISNYDPLYSLGGTKICTPFEDFILFTTFPALG